MSASVGYLLDSDLIFTSRITGTAKARGLEMSSCRTPADLLRRAAERPPACVLIDLNLNGLYIEEFLTELKKTSNPYVVGYGSHVAADILRNARSAGCDLVLPRSQFVAEMEESLPTWYVPAAKEGSTP
jgi:ActR/RegA family two-component response regulator